MAGTDESYTVEIDLQPHKRGDEWQGIPSIGPVLINDAQPTNALTRVRMHLTTRSGGLFRLDSDSSTNPHAPISITNATTWEVTIPAVDNFVQLDEPWSWDMEFYTAASTSPLTLYRGVLDVYADATR